LLEVSEAYFWTDAPGTAHYYLGPGLGRDAVQLPYALRVETAVAIIEWQFNRPIIVLIGWWRSMGKLTSVTVDDSTELTCTIVEYAIEV
jgi:hypothetical protein